MSERAVEITQTYSPAPGRRVIVEGIPATEVTLGADSDTVLDFTVSARVQVLVQRALYANDAPVQRLTYRAKRGSHSIASGGRVR